MNVKRPNENGQKSLYQSRNCFIINTPVVGLQNLNQSTNYTRGCIELTSKFSFLLCKLGKAVFICAPENVLAVSMLDHLDVCEEVNNITEPPLVQFMTGKVLGRMSLRRLLSFSMLRIASSITVPISGVCAADEITLQRAFSGTKKIFSTTYSSMSSSKPSPSASSS